MPEDAEHRVVYRAVADFSQLYAEAIKARAALKALRDEQVKSSTDGASAVEKETQARTRAVSAYQQQLRDERRLRREREEARKAERADALIAESLAKSRAATTRAEVTEEIRRQQVLSRGARDAEAAQLRLAALRRQQAAQQDQEIVRLSRARAAANQADVIGEQRLATERARTVQNEERAAAIRAKAQRDAETAEFRLASLRRRAGGTPGFARAARGAAESLLGGLESADEDTNRIGRVRAALNNLFQDVRRNGPGSATNGGILGNLFAGFQQVGNRVAGVVGGIIASFRRMLAIIALVLVAGGPLIALLGALGAAGLGLANILVSLGGTLAALPGLFAAAGAGVIALVVAIKPLMETFKQYGAYQDALAAGSEKSVDAQRESARQVRDTQRAYRDAGRAIVDSQYEERRAQISLTEARRDALRNLQDLRAELDRSSLNEENAVLSLQEAEENYQRTLADANSSNLDRQQALNRVKQAELDLRDVRVKNQRLSEDAVVAEKRGVEGSLSVVDARRQAQKATQNVSDAVQRLADATEDLGKAQRQQAAGGSAALTALQKYEAELGKLSPSAQTFVKALLGMGDTWKAIQRRVQERLFQPVVGQLDNLRLLLPVVDTLLSSAAATLGKLTAQGIAMVSSGPWRADFNELARANAVVIENLGQAGLYFADALRNIAIAAIPFTTFLVAGIKEVAKQFAEFTRRGRETGSIAKFLGETQDRISQLVRIGGNLVTVISSLYTSTKDFTSFMLDGIESVTKGWASWAKQTEDGSSTLQKFLRDVRPLLRDAYKLIEAVGEAFADIAKDPRNIEEAQKILEVFTTDLLPKLVELFGELSESGTLSSIASALADLIGAISKFLDAGGVLPLQLFVKALLSLATALFVIASNPVAAKVLVGVATALAAVAAASVIARFSGLFLLFGILSKIYAVGRSITTLGLAATLRNLAGVSARAGAAGAAGSAVGGAAGGVGGAAGEAAEATALRSAAAQLIVAARALQAAAARLGVAGTASGLGSVAGAGAGAGGGAAAGAATAGGIGLAGAAAIGAGVLVAIGETVQFGRGVYDVATDGKTTRERDKERNETFKRAVDDPSVGNTVSALDAFTKFPGQMLASLFTADFWKTFGEYFMHAIGGPIADFVTKDIPGLFGDLGSAFMEYLGSPVADFFTKDIPDFFGSLSDTFRTRISDPIREFFSLDISQQFAKIRGFISGTLVKSVQSAFTAMGGLIQRHIDTIRDTIATVFGDFIGIIKYDIPEAILGIGDLPIFTKAFWADLWSNIIWPNIFGPWVEAFRGIKDFIQNDLFSKEYWSGVVRRIVMTNTVQVLIRGFEAVYDFIANKLFSKEYWSGVIRRIVLTNTVQSLIRGFEAVSDFLFNKLFSPEYWGHVGRNIIYGNTAQKLVEGFNRVLEFLDTKVFSWEAWKHYFNVIYDNTLKPLRDFFTNLFDYVGEQWDKFWGTADREAEEHRDRKASGGLVRGGSTGVDDIPTWLTAGEWVMRKSVTDKPLAKQLFADINEERLDPAMLYGALNIAVQRSNNALPQQRYTPRVTTVDNSRGGLSVGDITINNPIRERSDRSLRQSLQVLALTNQR